MKSTIIAIIVAGVLVGCAPFGAVKDTNEYERYVVVDLVATHAKEQCGTDAVGSYIKQLRNETEFLEIYTKHIPYNEESHKIASILHDQAVELDERSQKGMSDEYCKAKTEIIKQGAERAMEAVLTKRTN